MPLDAIKRVLNSLTDLPAMPNVVIKAMGVIKDPYSGAIELSKVVENDHAITVELLKVVNSPYFGLNRDIQTVSESVSLLGFNKVKSIIITCALKPMMTTQNGKELWLHLLNTAVAAGTIAQKLGRSDYEESFTQGLMHDLGKIVFELYSPDKYRETITLAKNGTNILTAEKMVFGFDHTEIGYNLALRWGLPKQIVSVMQNHHKPQLSEFKTSAGIIYLADRIVQDVMPKYVIEPDISQHLGFEINNVDGFRRQVLDKARVLHASINTL